MEKFHLEHLLHSISLINSKYLEIQKVSGNRFNIFEILKVESKEVKLHSALMAELLNPKGSHDYGSIFLNLFIEEAKKTIPLNFLVSDRVKANLELHIGFKTTNNNCIIIENKIHAADQENQLIRYNNYKGNSKAILYLTLDGKDPDPKTCIGLQKNVHFHCVSYKELISNWIEQSYYQSINHSKLRETLAQYLTTIKTLTGQSIANMEQKKAIYHSIGTSIENIFAANELVKIWIDVRWHAEWDFWNELHVSLSNINTSLSFTPGFSPDHLNKAIHVKQNKNPWYGINVVLHQTEKYTISFDVQRGFENLYYGLLVFDNSAPIPSFVNARIFLEGKHEFDQIKTPESDKFWSYKKYPSHKINFHTFENETTLKLINPEFRRKVIEDLTQEIAVFIGDFRNQIVEDKIFLEN